MNVTLAHHWLVGMRGGEKVLDEFCALFPDAPLLTLVAAPEKVSARIRNRRIIPSVLQNFPGGVRRYKSLLPFHPMAVRGLQAPEETDLVLSSDASVIKGLDARGAMHVCYCHSPPRYLWDMQSTYLSQTSGLGLFGAAAFRAITPYVRRFDREAARRVTAFIANSHFVRDRIRNSYGRDAAVIHPPVELDAFSPSADVGDFYLVVSELTPYKRIDIVVRAFTKLGKPVVIIGDGSERAALQALAGPNVRFLGRQPDSVLREHYARCRAFLFPGVEDFGITPLEAQASGRPVLAFREGGVLETVMDGRTGLFFDSQTPEVLAELVTEFDRDWQRFDPAECRANAERFGAPRFRKEIQDFLDTLTGGAKAVTSGALVAA